MDSVWRPSTLLPTMLHTKYANLTPHNFSHDTCVMKRYVLMLCTDPTLFSCFFVCKSSLRTFLYTMETLERQPGFNCAFNRNCAISRLHVQWSHAILKLRNLVRNLEIGTDSEF